MKSLSTLLDAPRLAELGPTEEELIADLAWPVPGPATYGRDEHERPSATNGTSPPARPSGMSGIEHLEAIREGRMPPPPIAETMGFELVEVGHGRATFAVEPGERHYNPIGSVHGGLAATLLDSAMGCAVQSLLDAGVGFTTLDLNVKFVRPMSADTGRVLCEGTVLHAGSKIATAEGRLFSPRTGKLIAHGTCTCAVLPLAG